MKLRFGRRVYLIGCGRVGMAVMRGLVAAGWRVAGVRDQDRRAERAARRELRIAECGVQIEDANIILIATPDAEIAGVYSGLAPLLRAGQTVVHFSGAMESLGTGDCGLRNEKDARRTTRDARRTREDGRLALHPVMTLPDRRVRPDVFRNCWFALEGNRAGLAVGRRLVKDLGGRAFILRAEDKQLFHAACVFAANFLDVIIDAALETCRAARLKPGPAFTILEPLIRQALENIAAQGTVQALSGPAERGDDETIERHLRALINRDRRLAVLYRELTRHARRIARCKHARRNSKSQVPISNSKRRIPAARRAGRSRASARPRR